jgi:hypothetical protein
LWCCAGVWVFQWDPWDAEGRLEQLHGVPCALDLLAPLT